MTKFLETLRKLLEKSILLTNLEMWSIWMFQNYLLTEKMEGVKSVTIKRMFISWMYRSVAPSNDSGEAAGCCVSSRQRGGSLRWSGGTCGPCPGRGSSFLQRSGRASPGACAPPLWSIGCRGCVWRPCGRGRSGSLRRTCRWSPRPPSRSWALWGLRSDGQHAPANTRSAATD